MSMSAWEPDPTGRHQYRWFDGEEWTDQVADDGVQSVDPVTATEAGIPRDAPPLPPPPPGSVSSPEGADSDLGAEDPDLPNLLATHSQRLGSILLEVLLAIVTLAIGWLVWSLIVYAQGQTPAKQLMRLRVIRLENRTAASFSWMVLRELVLKAAVSILLSAVLILGILWLIVNGVVLLRDDRSQALWDKMAKTVVINDPNNRYRPTPLARNQPST